MADNTSTNTVKGDGISSAVSSFANYNYGTDALFSTNTANAGKLLSEAERSAFKSYLSTVTSEYWLSDTGSRGSITWQSYAKGDNTLADNTLKATGRVDGLEYKDRPLVRGSYGFTSGINPASFKHDVGGNWGLGGTEIARMELFRTTKPYFRSGSSVYNNPLCESSGTDRYGNQYRVSSVMNLIPGSESKVCGYVSSANTVKPVKTGQVFPAGTVFVFGFMKEHGEISNPDGFKIGRDDIWVGFIKSNSEVTISNRTNTIKSIYGFIEYYEKEEYITGVPIVSASKSVRPVYSLISGNIAFVRSNTSNATLSTSSKFGDLSTSGASYGENNKAVVKSSNTTIRSNISSSSNLSVAGTGGSATYTSSSNTINVPYGATSLTLNSSSFTTSNANHISALANTNTGTQKYAILGRTGLSVTLDLTSILNNTQIGSKATVSFYAEQANAANNSDVISVTPVTFDISVVAGAQQTITYSRGQGTSGTAPSNATVRTGQSYSFADGAGLSKDGNPFSCWEVVYTRYGQTSTTTRYISGGEAITAPDTTNGRITATALYSGIMAKKTTNSTSTVVTATFDLNLPEGYSGKFEADSSTGVSFNDDRTVRFEKMMVNSGTATAPSKPATITNSSGKTMTLEGWYLDKSGTGTKLIPGSNTPTLISNIKYYAKWIEGYTVTYVITGESGASQTGTWEDGTETEITEIVLPGASTVGPSKGTPKASNSLYMFNGWYTGINGGGTRVDKGTSFSKLGELGGNIRVYAYYDLTTFLAPAISVTDYPNPKNIPGTKYSIAEVKAAATDIAKNGSSSSYYSQYTSWMIGDSYHLYTLLNGKGASSADSWVEFRIVNVGQLDSDGTGLTFQAVHMLPTAYRMNSTDTNSGGWASSALRTKMQADGEIYRMFDSNLTDATYNVTRNSKGKLWLPSYSELAGTSQTYVDSDGSMFAYWRGKVTKPSGNNSCLVILGTRSGGSVASINFSGCWWERSPNTGNSKSFMSSDLNGIPYGSNSASYSLGVVPCLSL